MQKNANEFKELIFELMSGSLDLSCCRVEESEYVENEFSEGSFCEEMYEKVYHANCRLCERLGVEEDRDVESIIGNLIDIGKHLAMKMYDYGALFSRGIEEGKCS